MRTLNNVVCHETSKTSLASCWQWRLTSECQLTCQTHGWDDSWQLWMSCYHTVDLRASHLRSFRTLNFFSFPILFVKPAAPFFHLHVSLHTCCFSPRSGDQLFAVKTVVATELYWARQAVKGLFSIINNLGIRQNHRLAHVFVANLEKVQRWGFEKKY